MSPIDSKNIFLFSSNNSSSCFVISVSNALKFNNQTPDYYAPKANPIFLGHPQSPTPDADSNDFSIANTKWVDSRITKYHNEKIILGVDFTGSCTVPTPNKSSNDTKVPNTSWVRSIIDEYLSKYKMSLGSSKYIPYLLTNSLTLGIFFDNERFSIPSPRTTGIFYQEYP